MALCKRRHLEVLEALVLGYILIVFFLLLQDVVHSVETEHTGTTDSAGETLHPRSQDEVLIELGDFNL